MGQVIRADERFQLHNDRLAEQIAKQPLHSCQKPQAMPASLRWVGPLALVVWVTFITWLVMR